MSGPFMYDAVCLGECLVCQGCSCVMHVWALLLIEFECLCWRLFSEVFVTCKVTYRQSN